VGEKLTITYTLSIDDTQTGGITTKDFVVTITGTNDKPVIDTIAQKDLNEQTDTAALTTTIAVTFTDVDLANAEALKANNGSRVAETRRELDRLVKRERAAVARISVECKA
jgi:hypothetical protein